MQPIKNRNNKNEIHERNRLFFFAFKIPCNEHAAEKTSSAKIISKYKMPLMFNKSNNNGNVKNKKRVINDIVPKYFCSMGIIFIFKKRIINFIIILPIIY